jgi:two-component system alkaline phosphatase synthesis response regulator PhoP
MSTRPSHTEATEARPEAQPGHTILFVDDDRDFLLAQRTFFEARGFTVLSAEDPEQARRVLETEQPDLIFLDLMMEHYDDGFRLAREIRTQERHAHIPLVMLSGVAAATGKRFDHEADGLRQWSKLDRFIDKPVTGRQLLKAVDEHLSNAAA